MLINEKLQIHTVDCQYLYPRFAAAYLLVKGNKAAFVDNNTTHAVPLLLKALSEQGLKPTDVESVIITHIHLDHAGGSSALMKACPNAKLLAHPKAARHAIDPSRLIASAKIVYGEDVFEKLYGKIEPIDASRVQALEDNTTVSFHGSSLKFIHTKGHASHHFCIYSEETKSVFTGDAFGLYYPDIQPEKGFFTFASTSPTDFDAEEAIKSLDRIVATGAQTAYPTHYGAVTELSKKAEEIKKHILESERVVNAAKTHARNIQESSPKITKENLTAELTRFCQREMTQYFKTKFKSLNFTPSQKQKEMLTLDFQINAQGLAYKAGVI